jgi:neutral/alkaline ceramidase-like enzyme
MLMGLAYSNITPDKPMELLGYGDRDHSYEGIHDPLFVYALVLQQKEQLPMVWFSVDVCIIDSDCAKALKHEITQNTGIPEDSLQIQATHTHSAPNIFALHAKNGEVEKAYFKLLVDQFSRALEEARRDLRSVLVELRSGVGTIGINRRGLEKLIDPRLFLLTFVDEIDKTAVGAVFYYSCHLTTLGVDNYLVSADWVGPVREWYQQSRGIPLMFIQGAEGNVDPKTRGVLDMSDPKQAYGVSFAEMAAISQEMITCIENTEITEPVSKFSEVMITQKELTLPLRSGIMTQDDVKKAIDTWKVGFAEFLGIEPDEVPEDHTINALIKKRCITFRVSPEETKKQTQKQFSYTNFLWTYQQNKAYLQLEHGTITLNITIINFGSFVVIGLPVEPLMNINLNLKKSVENRVVVAAGLFNGFFGYFPHSENFKEDKADQLYETVSTIFSSDAADILLSEIALLIDTPNFKLGDSKL